MMRYIQRWTTWARQLSPVYQVIGATLVFIATVSFVMTYANQQVVDSHADHSSSYTVVDPLGSLLHFDSGHYTYIATHGYNAQESAFFPLYPLLVSAAIRCGLSAQVALLAISWLFCIASCIVLFRWLQFELHKRRSSLSPWSVMGLIAIFPTSFFLILGYSESLFLFVTISALYAYRRQHYVTAALFAALATACRVQGVTLIVFFLADYFLDSKQRDTRKLIPIITAPIGIGLYMIFLWQHFDNPLQFISAQQHWGRLSGNPIKNLISSFTPVYAWFIPVLITMFYAVYKKLGWSWLLYCAATILVPLSSGRFDSLNRYMLVLPALFLALMLWGARFPRWLVYVYITSSAFLLAWSMLLFANDYWVA